MKKFFTLLVAVASLLASCSKDNVAIDTPATGEQVITFEVNSPELTTRYGEGDQATQLEWFVYEGALPSGPFVSDNSMPTLVPGLGGSKALDGKKTTVSLKLIQGRSYHVLFWAHHPGVSSSSSSTLGTANTVYHVNPADATMSVDYTKLTANQEKYDAFYKFHSVGLVSSSTQGGEVYLSRPFAQLNIATSTTDIEDAKMADLEVKYTGVGVKTYTTLNFITGAVSNPQSTIFNVTTKANGEFKYNNKTYEIISMNYLLVNEEELVDVKLMLQEDIEESAEVLDRAYHNIHIQRNHRTYIFGDLYTQPANFNVIIKDEFTKEDYNEER